MALTYKAPLRRDGRVKKPVDRSQVTVQLTLPTLVLCSTPGCDEPAKGRRLCQRHYMTQWTRGEHVFEPIRDHALTKVRVFLYQRSLSRLDALAKSRGLTRSEFIREVMDSLVAAAEGGAT
jgi:hypothetical protein